MEVIVESSYGELNFKGTNNRNQSIALSGNKESVSPMESVLMAAASCSSIDVEMILKKMRQEVTNIKVEVKGTRADAIPAVFTDIHLHYIITGNVKQEKAEKAVQMSMEEYCSVSIMLAKAAKITYTIEVHNIGLNEEI